MVVTTAIIFPVFLAVTAAFSDKIPEAYLPTAEHIRSTCMEKTGAKEDMIEQITYGGFVEDRPLMCYMACLVEMFNWFRDDDLIDHDKAIADVLDDIKVEFSKMLLACKEIRGKDRCETAFLSNKCYYEYNPDVRRR